MIGILDYGAGNLASVSKAVEYLGEDCIDTNDLDRLRNASGLILPGVGAFGEAVKNLKKNGFVDFIPDYLKSGRPFLGICLGLQLLFNESEETPGAMGINLLSGKIRKIPAENGLKVPHVGWNSLEINPSSRLFKGIRENEYVYFVHSYYLEADDPCDIAARTVYGVKIDAAVERDNLFACQFHPEKSGRAGLMILQNFIDITKEA